MALPGVWFYRNDMALSLSGLQSSTMSSTSYVNNSTNVTASVWRVLTTASSAAVITNRRLVYRAGTNGAYRGIVQSTEHSMSTGTRGLAIISVHHLGIDAEWRVPFLVEPRRTT